MATSIQRILIMTILLDVVLAVVLTIAHSTGESMTETEMDQKIGMYGNWSTSYNERIETDTYDEGGSLLDPSFGNSIPMGRELWEIFTKGFDLKDYGSCLGEDCSYKYAWYLRSGILLFFVMVNALLALEIFLMIKNRKYS